MPKLNSAIRSLKNNASRGNLKAVYELYVKYSDGVEIKTNPIEREKLRCKGVDALSFYTNDDGIETPINKFQLTSLQLVSYKQFENLEVHFDSNLTVFIGDNGAGKTSILDSIAKTFSIINNRIVRKGRVGKTLDDWDIKIGSIEPAEIIANFQLGKHTFYNGSIVRSPKGISSPKSTELTSFSSYSNMLRDFNTEQVKLDFGELNIPLLAQYTVERSSMKSKHYFNIEFTPELGMESRFDAIDKSVLDGTGNLNEFLEWFIKLDNLANAISSTGFYELKKQIDELEKVVTGDDHPLMSLLSDFRLKLSRYEQPKTDDNNTPEFFKRNLATIKSAMVGVFPEIADVWVDRASGKSQVMLDLSGSKINIFQASKGQQILFSLVSDISRRLILLNPSLKNPLNGQGILLIDEIELHLHPKWQQCIIKNISKTFPNIQFIITTHSPQVLTSIHKENIRSIGVNTENEQVAVKPLSHSYARTSSDVLETIMFVNSTPNVPEKKMLDKYSQFIEQGDFDSDDVNILEKRLIKELGIEHPILLNLFRLKQRRMRFKKE